LNIMKILFIILILLQVIGKLSMGNKAGNLLANDITVDSSITKVVLLGTGTPNATPERSGPAVAIIVQNTSYIIDCGPGVVRRAAEASSKGFEQLKPENLKHLFITHLHSDHTLGLPDILLSPWVLDREEPLNIWGPYGIQDMVTNITKAYKRDIDIRLSGLQPANENGYKANVTEFKQGLIFGDSNVTVYAYKVDHGDWDEAYCFRFVTPDKVITVSGDCTPCDGILEASTGCDILIHEVYSFEKFKERMPEWKKYHKAAHTSTIELAQLAKKVRPKLLVLYHILNWGATPEQMIDEIKTEYDGKIQCGSDLDVIY
jgi:ribonuclease BN (tRNA processing enzyme)